MLNQKHNVFKGQKSKSKILLVFICIFGLILYYGCGRDDDGGITDPSSFSISEASGNVKTSIVQSQKTIGNIKIAFAASHDYTMDYTVEDSETDETKKLTKEDFQLANNVLTAKDSVANKVNLVDSSDGPVEKTITINFTFKANDASLKNNTQTLSVEVKLTKAQKVNDSNIDNVITTILNGIDENSHIDLKTGSVPNIKYAKFTLKTGTYATGVYTVKDEEASNPIEEFTDAFITEIKETLDFYLPKIAEIKSVNLSTKEAEGGGAGDKYYKVYYDITWDDKYELSVTEIAFQFDLK